MADAFIRGITSVLNSKMTGTKFHHFAVYGKNLQTNTVVIVTIGSHVWTSESPGDLVGGRLLVKMRKTHSRRGKRLKDIEEITVTVQNPGQTTPDTLDPKPSVYIFAEP